MFIKSTLFSKGHPLSQEPRLYDRLEAHKQRTLNDIRKISDLGQMTEQFLERVVKESLVEPLAIQFDKKTRKIRTEGLDGSHYRPDSLGGRMYARGGGDALLRGQQQVARLSIPFTGDRVLLQFAVIPCNYEWHCHVPPLSLMSWAIGCSIVWAPRLPSRDAGAHRAREHPPVLCRGFPADAAVTA